MKDLFQLIETILFDEFYQLYEARSSINKGNVSEGLLGAAVATSFRNPTKPVTSQSVLATLKDLDKTSNLSKTDKITIKTKTFLTLPNPSIKGSQPNKVSLQIGLTKLNYEAMFDSDLFSSIVEGVIKFANSSQVKTYANKVYEDPKSNNIIIKSIGTEDERNTKIDFIVLIDNVQIPWGALTVKTTSKQLGQIGKNFKASGPHRGIHTLFSELFGIQINSNLEEIYVKAIESKDESIIMGAIDKIYKDAELKIQQRFGGDEEELIDLLTTFALGIRKEATLNQQGVLLLQLGKKDFQVFDFDTLVSVLSDPEIEVEIGVELEWYSTKPYLSIWMNVNGKPYGKIISVRPKFEKSTNKVRHYVEKEKGLEKLIKVLNFN